MYKIYYSRKEFALLNNHPSYLAHLNFKEKNVLLSESSVGINGENTIYKRRVPCIVPPLFTLRFSTGVCVCHFSTRNVTICKKAPKAP